MQSKKMMVSNIVNAITASTEMKFQEKFVEFLSIICMYNNLEFEKVQPSNGDAKNDGWIPSKNIYFAMYSPNEANISQLKQINNKLESDLDGLCNHVFIKNHWGKNIEKFYLIVNTLDKELPADPERIKDATIIKIKEKYNKEFDVEIIAAKNIARYLLECDVEILDKINLHFDIYNAEHNFTIEDINDFIDDYVGYLVEQNNNNSLGTDYSRIKIEKKIEINKLDDLKSHILDKMDAVDNINKYLTMINSEGWSIDNYNKAKNYVISKYLELSKSLKGTELYNTLLDELLCNDNLIGSKAKILESIVIDIFIKCDIFEKEC